MKFDTAISTRALKARYDIAEDGPTRRSLAIVIDHIEAEIRGDLEATMATLVDAPVYHIHCMTRADGTTFSTEVRGVDQVRQMYVGAFASRAPQLQQYAVTMVVADERGVITDGVLRTPWKGADLRGLGYDVDAEGDYLYEGRLCNLWPNDGQGRLIGEDFYFDPAAFRAMPGRRILW